MALRRSDCSGTGRSMKASERVAGLSVNLGPGSAIRRDRQIRRRSRPDGKIVLAGDVMTGSIPDANCDLVIARLLPDGGIDSEFGEDGKVVVPFDLGAPDSYL